MCLIVAALLPGCRHPSVVPTYEYHHRYESMSDQYDPPVSLVLLKPGADLGSYTDIVVGEFTTGREWVRDAEMASQYAGIFFRKVLARELVESGHFYVLFGPEYRAGYPTAVIEGKITVFDTGSGLGRFLSPYLFFLQSAATDLQVEGRLRDAQSGDIVLEFADRRRFLGRTPWGPTFQTLNDDWAMKQTCMLTAGALADLLGYLRNKASGATNL